MSAAQQALHYKTPQSVFDVSSPRKIIRRTSYSWRKAQLYKPIFDSLLDNAKTTFIPCPPKLSPSTFRGVLSDALLWLIDNFTEANGMYDPTKDKYSNKDYAMLKGQIRNHIRTNGIEVEFLTSIAKQQVELVNSMVQVDDKVQAQWRDLVVAFVSNEATPILHIKDIQLLQHDLDWLAKLLEGTSFLQRITPTSIELVRQ